MFRHNSKLINGASKDLANKIGQRKGSRFNTHHNVGNWNLMQILLLDSVVKYHEGLSTPNEFPAIYAGRKSLLLRVHGTDVVFYMSSCNFQIVVYFSEEKNLGSCVFGSHTGERWSVRRLIKYFPFYTVGGFNSLKSTFFWLTRESATRNGVSAMVNTSIWKLVK